MTTVLIVEDEPDIRLLTRIVLEGAGHEVMEVGTGEEALAVLEERAPDLLLLDIRLPGIDGLDVLTRMHDKPEWQSIPVIIMSAHSSPETLARAQDMGARTYLLKPFTQEALLDAVRDCGF